jgi:hypothetical protein
VANKEEKASKSAFRAPVSVIAIVVVLAVGAGVFFFLERAAKQPPPAPPPLTGDARAYVRNLRLLDVEMKAHESYLKQSVVEITGKIGNQGDRVLSVVEINCVFYDAYGQVVLRERVPIVSQKMGNLAPGDLKGFRLAFDNIPESWNQAMPQLVIARIDFA